MERERSQTVGEFENQYCKFRPYNWVEIEGILKPVIFKVVTYDLKSLGLRKNPNIMSFTIGEWSRLKKNEVLPGKSDRGGIWSALKLAGARTLAKYISEKYQRETRIFLVCVDTPVFANSYRVKSRGVMLLEELGVI